MVSIAWIPMRNRLLLFWLKRNCICGGLRSKVKGHSNNKCFFDDCFDKNIPIENSTYCNILSYNFMILHEILVSNGQARMVFCLLKLFPYIFCFGVTFGPIPQVSSRQSNFLNFWRENSTHYGVVVLRHWPFVIRTKSLNVFQFCNEIRKG